MNLKSAGVGSAGAVALLVAAVVPDSASSPRPGRKCAFINTYGCRAPPKRR